MRINKFESADQKPLGEGGERKIYVNPEDESKIISELREEAEKDTPRQLKGRYYLTKIAHLLLPKNIPDIYQAGESIDEKQTVDRKRISHTRGHSRLQEIRRSGEDEESAREQIVQEIGEGATELDEELERIGISYNIIDSNVGNYIKDKNGNVYYLETFKPWEVSPGDPKELEAFFNEEELRDAIGDISDPEVKEKATQYLKRILVLLEEERQEMQEHHEDLSPYFKELEEIFTPFLRKDKLATLHAIKTREEALNSEERKSAMKVLPLILEKLRFLGGKVAITDEEYIELSEKYTTLSQAIGMVNRGTVDHDR